VHFSLIAGLGPTLYFELIKGDQIIQSLDPMEGVFSPVVKTVAFKGAGSSIDSLRASADRDPTNNRIFSVRCVSKTITALGISLKIFNVDSL